MTECVSLFNRTGIRTVIIIAVWFAVTIVVQTI
jgi:hypothetical protein